jgi:hypothetical protein
VEPVPKMAVMDKELTGRSSAKKWSTRRFV